MTTAHMARLILLGAIGMTIIAFAAHTGVESQERWGLIRECLVEVGPQLGAKDFCHARAILEMHAE